MIIAMKYVYVKCCSEMKRLSEVGKKLYMEFSENTGVLIQQV